MMTTISSAGTPLYKGAEIAIKTLEQLGVAVCFAYPGASAIEFHQALTDSPIRVILPRHEQGGAFAAGGYARATGRVGVCMATSGPGATNLLTGIADAYMDSIPVVIITGQVESCNIGKNAFQEIDIIGMTRPIVKHNYLVRNAADIASTIREAFALAADGRPGPVWIDITRDAQKQCMAWEPERVCSAAKRAPAATAGDLENVRSMLKDSLRPCIYAGGGIISGNAANELREFAESYHIPVATSLLGIGAFPETHPLALKFFGMHGNYCANYAVNECDLLLVFGARFSDRSTGDPARFASGSRIVHVDIDASEINKNVRADLGIHADIRQFLAALNETPCYRERLEWFQTIAGWQREHPLSYDLAPDALKPQQVVEMLDLLTGGDAIIVPGVGQHQMWAAQFFRYTRPRQLLTSGGLGTMGFGLPAAMGAKLAFPDACVINVDGDGSFQMNIQELGTLAAEEIALKMVILNNQHLGMVAQMEDIFYRGKRGNTDLRLKSARPFPSFIGIAQSYGIPGRDVFHPGELADAIREMLAAPGPFLLDCHTLYQDHVLPMIPSGRSYREIMV